MRNFLNEMPVCFRIFGYGEDVEPVIESLKGVLPVGVEAVMMKEGELPEPTEFDKMAIVLMSDYIQDACDASYSFYQADVLSLIIHTDEMEFVDGACDCSMVAEIAQMQPIVMALIAPLAHEGPVNYDFHDLRTLLRDSGYFRCWTVEGSSIAPVKSVLEKLDREISSYFKMKSERLAILISCNPQSASGVKASDIGCLSDFISGFNDGIDPKWGFYLDPAIMPDNIRITVITTGERIKYDF